MHYRALFAALSFLLLAACGSDTTTDDPGQAHTDAGADATGGTDAGGPGDVGAEVTIDPLDEFAWCEGDTQLMYDPVSGAQLETFPDEFFTVDDPDSPTGLRLAMNLETSPWLEGVAPLIGSTLADLGVLSGFGTHGGVLLRFTHPIGELAADGEAAATSDTLMFLDMETTPPTPVPYDVVYSDEGRDVMLWPLRPLRPMTQHAVVLTAAHLADDGGCVQPSPTMKQLLAGLAEDERLLRVQPRYQELLDTLELAPEDVSAATVFTTHGDLEILFDVAAVVREQTVDWLADPVCVEEANFVKCEGAFEVSDYREPQIILDAEPDATYTLPVTVWLPREGEGPFPTILFGHGINDSRRSGGSLASRFAPDGFAVIAADALEHNEHPTRTPEDEGTLDALRILGMDLTAFEIDAQALRGNFNQTAVDRLQLIELIRQAPDVDGDDVPDLDIEKLGYFGISLGGMMGPPLMALSGDFSLGVYTVAGGGLLTFATDNRQFNPMKPLVYNLVGSEEDFNRLLTVAQALIDPADPATFAPHVLHDRRVGETVPSLLFSVAAADQTVPAASGRVLARALQAEHLGTVVEPIFGIPLADGPVISGNLADGTATAAFFQFDEVSEGDGMTLAHHNNTPFSPESTAQIRRFLETWRDGEVPVLIDPFVDE